MTRCLLALGLQPLLRLGVANHTIEQLIFLKNAVS